MVSLADKEHAIIKYVKTFQDYRDENIGMEGLTDGCVFGAMLRYATNFKINYGDLFENGKKWTFKLSNLKKIVALIEDYFENQLSKGIRTRDLDLVEIARNNNTEEVIKLFQLVIAVMTEAPNKQDHINAIMSLDQRSQSTFVCIIQDILQNRIIEANETKQVKIYSMLNQIQTENTLLKQQIEVLLSDNFQLQKENQALKLRVSEHQEELEELRGDQIDRSYLSDDTKEKDHLKNTIETLKQKLLSTVRSSQLKLSNLKQQNSFLQRRIERYEQMQQELAEVKQKNAQNFEDQNSTWRKQIHGLVRQLEHKDELISKLNEEINSAHEIRKNIEEKQLDAKIQLQKKDIRFKQLEKMVTKRYHKMPIVGMTSNPSISKLSSELQSLDQVDIQDLQSELEQTRKKMKEYERENNRLKKNFNNFETEKKKLQRLIIDLTKEKKQHVQLLLSTNFDLYIENSSLRDKLVKSKITI